MKNALLILLLIPAWAAAQVGVNTTTPNAMLDVSSTNNGVLIPRIGLTSALDNATVINPAGGALAVSTLVFNTATAGMAPNDVVPGFYYWNGSRWVAVGSGLHWALNGNTATNDPAAPATYGTSTIAGTENFVGTTDGNDVVLGTNNVERMRIEQGTGDVGVGTDAPFGKVHAYTNTIGQAALVGESYYTGAASGIGVYARAINALGYGYGGYFQGGNRGVHTINSAVGFAGTTYGLYSESTGSGGTRIGGYFTASGGANNYGIVVPQTGGAVGFGTTTPLYRVHVEEQTIGATALRTENTSVANSDGRGIWGRSVNNPGYGYGVYAEGGYMGLRATSIGSTYTGTTYGVYGTATGTTGTRIGGYFSASGGTVNYALQAAGTVRINDGTQGNGRVLTSDALGVASWELPGANNVVGVLGAGVNVPTTQTATYLYTNSYITLPPGRYAVQVVMLLAPVGSPVVMSPNNSSFWMRSTFTDTTVSNTPSPDIVGSPLISGNLAGSSSYGLVTGMVVINNTTAGNKTYYYKAGRVVPNNTTTTMSLFGGSWDEDTIVAIRIN